jgi:uncharacterized membrane protein YesL
MKIDGIMGKAYIVCDWISKLAYVNLLWIIFTLAGFVVFGVMPATVSLFTVLREWKLKDNDIPIFKTFFNTYKKELIRANAMGFFLIVTGILLFFNFNIAMNIEGNNQVIIMVPIIIVTFMYLSSLLYLLPVYVHFELSFINYFKNSFYLAVINMHITISLAIIILFICLLLSFFPGFIPFFSASIISMVLMQGATIAIRRTEVLQNKYSDKEF